jgi:hypothetical protein
MIFSQALMTYSILYYVTQLSLIHKPLSVQYAYFAIPILYYSLYLASIAISYLASPNHHTLISCQFVLQSIHL